MSVKELLLNLTQSAKGGLAENLVDLFRNKTTTFRQINEEENRYNNDFFSSGSLLGEIKVSPFGGDLEGAEDELVIYTFQTKKEVTERSGKKAQYELAKKILKEAQRYSAGFFIFYDDNGSFRLSLIYDTPQPNGKREWSNFKRFTYYVSKEQTNKTFINRLDVADFSSFEKIKEAFSVEKVTKEFYTEIANWYFWSLKYVKFPKDAEVEKNGRNIALIRFITRIIFIWFMKQKNLISNNLFNKDEIKKALKNLSNKESTYYKAILQNLFFATLNTPIKERKFRREHSFQGKNKDYMEHTYYRYHSLFNNPDDMLKIFKDIPFLNGGLFECLDKSKDDPSNDTGNEIRIDGFSDKETNQTIFPNELFFSDEKEVDLNKDFGTVKKKYKTRGLLNILQSYNFTIDENTPADEEIALDPELLGRVFENLLASYNPETASTARKATGSYYTPREIVNYMVDESLIAYLKNKVLEGAKSFIELGTRQSDMFGNSSRIGQLLIEEELLPTRWINKDLSAEASAKAEDHLEKELRKLISYSEDSHSFTDKETDILINAINTAKILDPAVGSGAFPMGVLHKLVLILSKLDPHNNKWKQQQISAIETNVTDSKLKRQLTEKTEENFSRNELDYGRKLYLIQNCLYGVDIQPIAIQIAKLRFFISLLVDEKVEKAPLLDKGGWGEVDNFGIEPLPNLETKLVAANTLISLPESLTLKPREIEKLEKELFDLRRKYFITSSETEKKQLEAKDRELRGKIKTELNEKGFPAEYAEKISGWDPYNTNIASGWFDPEWMFGPDVKNGFDVVIGNPPYVVTKKSLYKEFDWHGDLYTMFFELSIKILLRFKGTLSFITPRFFLFNQSNFELRKYFLNELNILSMAECNPFEAVTENEITILTKDKSKVEKIDFHIYTDGRITFLNTVQKSWIRNNSLYEINPYLTEDVFSLLQKIKNGNKLLGQISFSKRGAEIGKAELRESSKGKTILLGYDVDKYFISPTSAKIETSHKEYHRLKKIFHQPNILFLRRVSKDLISAVSNNSFAFSKNLYGIMPNANFSEHFLCVLLNSKLLNFYYKKKFSTKKEDVFPEIQTYLYEQLPIKSISRSDQKPFIEISSKVNFAKQQNPQTNTQHLEDQIDIMVYKLYNLSYEEVKIIDPGIEKIISKINYEKFEIK